MAADTILDGKVAIVTGGGRGIGRAHCLELARHGAVVIVNDPGVTRDGSASGERPADEVAEEIRAAGGTAATDYGSVAEWASCQRLVEETVSRFGRLDVVVNNAGIIRDRTIVNLERQDWDQTLAVHLTGTLAMTKYAATYWRAQAKAGATPNGRIINTTSGAGMFGNVGQAAYGAAKAGIINLTLTAALELGRYGVTVNAISPLAATRLSADGFTPGDPALKPGRSSPVVAWLASDASQWLTGQVLRVEGASLVRAEGWSIAPARYPAPDGAQLTIDDVDDAVRLLWGVAPSGLRSRLKYSAGRQM